MDTKQVKIEQDKLSSGPGQKTRDQELAEALDRVYRKYGSDLSAFARDVQRDMVKSAVRSTE